MASRNPIRPWSAGLAICTGMALALASPAAVAQAAAAAAAPPIAPASAAPPSLPAASANRAADATESPWWHNGQPSALAEEAVALLADAESHGLAPEDYQARTLAQALSRAASGTASTTAQESSTRLGSALEAALLRFFTDLQRGRVDPARVHNGLSTHADLLLPAKPDSNATSALRALVSGAPLAKVVAALQPQHPSYAPLQAALKQVRAAVRAQPGDAKRTPRGLDPARQIMLAMERLRWRPQPNATRWVEVNLPEFTLRMVARDAQGQAQVQASMAVITGVANKHETPRMLAELRHIGFNPAWHVPVSIARKELVPQFRQSGLPGGFQVVDWNGRNISGEPGSLDAVAAGQAQLRQAPGAGNALGTIVFFMPNPDQIYLHHTPSVGLFKRQRRDFSHGCVRVENPAALAQFLLQDQPDWTIERIRRAMASGRSQTVALGTPAPVLLTYDTVTLQDGVPQYHADLYGLDAELAAALRQRPRPQPLDL